ncbi:MAG: sugar phosphate isomerase/epimerase [Ardenticatenaceae bacterium]|nr:sugar phosphate isomerase/epimerase [Ardenticatenaceae bacterium]
MWKMCVFTVMLPDMTPEAAAGALRMAGYAGVEWRIKTIPEAVRREAPSFWGNNLCTFAPTTADAERARDIAQAHGLAIPGLGTYIDVGDVAAVEQAMSFARICGAPQIRVSTGAWPNEGTYAEAFAKAQAFLGEAQVLAKQYGVKALIEIHHRTIAPSAGLAYRLVSAFDPAYVGVIHDAGNMVYEGFEAYQMGLELLGPYVAHVHLKNAAWQRPSGGGVWQCTWAPLADGVVEWQALFAALRHVGYTGWVGFEDFSQERPSAEALAANFQFIQEQLVEK